MERDAAPFLRVRGLTKRFGAKTAVDDLSFDAYAGETLGLLGPNGAGKSTTFLCLAGLMRPDAGTIALAGEVLGAQRSRRIALIPETPDTFPALSVWEHLVFVARGCNLADGWQDRGDALLRRLGLANDRDALGTELSKGMRQKTLIAATVLAGAPVVLFDEPMIGLDPLGQRELREIMRALRAEGTTLLVSTHQLDAAETLCDRILILKAGHEVAAGSVAELRATPEGERSLEERFLEITQ
jgi:ABC-type multidrug transport system ATPase subunit